MLLFIDTANINIIQRAIESQVVDGVTTNPSSVAKENLLNKEAVYKHYENICKYLQNNVSIEILSTTLKNMIKEAEKIANISPKIIIKVPINQNGIGMITILKKKNIRTNCTLVFSVSQAILAAKAGATYISPFIGRLDDINQSGLGMLRQIKEAFTKYSFDTKILAASIRDIQHIEACLELGIDAITISPNLLDEMFKHELTERGLKKFQEDYHNAYN